MTFFDDIKSKHLSNYVLVTIGDPDDPIHRISTQKVRLGEDYYKPILLNIPAISESLDVENRKYKISSLRLSISDYKEDGVRFSDSLNQLMNQEVNIYYASPSCKTLEDCYSAGVFIVRSFTQDQDKVGLNCEDLSQDKLHKDLPLETLGDNSTIADKYKNKPIPLVFGKVDKSPTVIKGRTIVLENSTGIGSVINGNGDETNQSFNFEEIKDSPLYIYTGDIYSGVNKILLQTEDTDFSVEEPLDSDIFIPIYSAGQSQWNIKSNREITLNQTPLFNANGIQIQSIYTPETIVIGSAANYQFDNSGNYINDSYDDTLNYFETGNEHLALDGNLNTFNHINTSLSIAGSVTGDEDNPYSMPTGSFSFYIIDIKTSLPFSIKSSFTGIKLMLNGYRMPINPFLWVIPQLNQDVGYGDTVNLNELFYFGNMSDNLASMRDIVFDAENYPIGSLFGLTILPSVREGGSYRLAFGGIVIGDENNNVTIDAELDAKIRDVLITGYADIGNPLEKNFYIDITGRGDEAPTLQKIYEEILGEDILDFDGTLNQDGLSMGSYAFTLDKKINSKKLLEEISASSGLFPYFKNGDFNVKSIKSFYNGENKTIMGDDILSYKYDRTKIEKVYTRVNVKYHYDYGLKDFTKETGYIESIIGINYGEGGYDTSYFGDDFDQELIFESKYIRDKTTALNLAEYLYGLYANQHNLITVKLPLNYLVFELGDIVKFDSLIQGRKIFGENYTKSIIRNGQVLYPYFFITQIRKNLDNVEIKLYQLHKFDAVPIVYGCTDILATPETYNQYAHVDDGSCEYPVIVQGCTNPLALNYVEGAVIDNGSCVLPAILEPPVIITPVEDAVIPIEFEGDEEIELIADIPRNSAFDENFGAEETIIYEGGTGLPTNNPSQPANYMKISGMTEEEFSSINWDGSSIDVISDYGGGDKFGNVSQADFSHGICYIQAELYDNSNMQFYPNDTVKIYTLGESINNSDWYGTNESVTLLGGEGNLITRINSSQEGCVLNLGEQPNGIYNVSFDIHKRGSVSSIKVALRNIFSMSVGGESSNITITDSPIPVSITLSLEETFSQLWITGVEDIASASKLIIDNVSVIKQATQTLQNPVINVTWTPSLNLLSPVGNLDYVPSGGYMVRILEDISAPTALYQYALTATDNNMVHSIDFADVAGLPQNTPLVLQVIVATEDTYLGTPVFIEPSASDSINFSWGLVSGDITGEGLVNISDIVQIAQHIMGETELTAEQLSAADMNGDGIVNVVDALLLVQNILED